MRFWRRLGRAFAEPVSQWLDRSQLYDLSPDRKAAGRRFYVKSVVQPSREAQNLVTFHLHVERKMIHRCLSDRPKSKVTS